MKQKNLTTFYLERLDKFWLPARRWRKANAIILMLIFGLIFGLLVGLLSGLLSGGGVSLKQKILLWLLYHLGKMPKDYIPFLDYATERILLRQVGGGYMFVHRLLMDYFASLDSSGALEREQVSTMQTQRDA